MLELNDEIVESTEDDWTIYRGWDALRPSATSAHWGFIFAGQEKRPESLGINRTGSVASFLFRGHMIELYGPAAAKYADHTSGPIKSEVTAAIQALPEVREAIDNEHIEAALVALRSIPAVHSRPPRRATTVAMRREVYDRDEGRCVECGSAFDLQYDHIIPLAMGGAHSVDNLQLLCSACNQRKGTQIG